VRLGDEQAIVPVTVTAGQVEPILLGIDAGKLIPGAAYAGNDQVNLGLGELSGKFVAMPAFSLLDQSGNAFDSNSTAGKDLVIAAFHTTCHQTCPLYTALFFQLQTRLPPGVLLAEVTTDPATDTPAALDAYGRSIQANWTFATGSADALAAFWKPFGVELSSGDSHVSTLRSSTVTDTCGSSIAACPTSATRSRRLTTLGARDKELASHGVVGGAQRSGSLPPSPP
jgi:cytochrome oxidase Cu insertion factor (SCO1/SenC/PrrC family)